MKLPPPSQWHKVRLQFSRSKWLGWEINVFIAPNDRKSIIFVRYWMRKWRIEALNKVYRND